MTDLRTVALVKQVPVGDVVLGADARVARAGHEAEMNPWCRRAVAQAVRFGRCTAVTMGPPAAADVLREAVACGAADAVHLSDPVLAGADCLVTAKALAAVVARLDGTDLVLVGHSSTDGSTGAIGPMVAHLLDLPFIGPALELDRDGATLRATLQTDGATETVTVTLPAVVAVAERSCAPAKAPVESWPPESVVRRWSAADLDEPVRGDGSPTHVVGLRNVARTRERGRYDAAEAARVLAALDLRGRPAPTATVPRPRSTGSLTEGVLVVGDGFDEPGRRALLGDMAAIAPGPVVYAGPPADDLARWGADEHVVLTAAQPRAVVAALTEWLWSAGLPWAIVGGSTTWEREVLSRLAVALDAGLMSDLVGVTTRAGRLVGLKPTGAGALAEITSTGPTQIATLRTGTLPLRLPRAAGPLPRHTLHVAGDPAVSRLDHVADDSYDALDRADVVIGLGLGVPPDEYGLLDELRSVLGAEFGATRKVTDAGWLPHSRQIGITARSIAPRLYIAIGASGKLNHTAGVHRAGTVVAINSDPEAPVFDFCDIGIVGDWRTVVPVLTAELLAARAVPS